MRATVAVVHGPGAAATIPEIVAACGDDFDPVLLLVLGSEDDQQLAEVARDAAATTTLTPGEDVATQAAAAVAAHDAAGVVTFADRFVGLVDDVRRIASLPGRSDDAGRWRKDVQRAQLAAAGLFSGPWRSAVGPDALRRAVAEVGFPAIVKPASGTGSAGIVVLHDEEELAPAERQLAAMSGCVVERYFGAERLPQAEWLADYVSVESTSGGRGDRRHFGVTLRPPLAPPVRETGSVVSDLLTDEQLQDVLAAADGALDALGVTHLVTHTEVKIRRDGVEVLEVNGRLGGYVEQMTLRRAGASAVRLALDAAVGEPVCAPSVRTDRHLFSLLFPAPLDAVELLRGPGREALARLPGVWRVDAIRPPGPLDPLREGTSGYLCSIWIEADSATRLHANVRDAVRAIAEGCLYRFEDGSISAANAWAEGFAASRPAAAPPDARSGQERESVCSSTRRK